MNLDNVKLTERIVDSDGNLIGDFTSMEFNVFRLKLLRGEIEGDYFVVDEQGVNHAINEFACCLTYHFFKDDSNILCEIVKTQMDKRKKVRK